MRPIKTNAKKIQSPFATGAKNASFIPGIDELEGQRGERAAGEIAGQINPDIRGLLQVHEGDAGGDGGLNAPPEMPPSANAIVITVKPIARP